MFLQLPETLDPTEVAAITGALGNAEFVNGALTAQGEAARVKNNLQLVRGSAIAGRASEIVVRALQRNELVQRATNPKVILPPLFCRYDVGMGYGMHRDAPLMGDRQRLRTDISVTVFLNDASEYDGGDLVLHTDEGDKRVRGEAGEAFAYPSGMLHEVTPVERGTRLVAVTWIQSFVRHADQRRVLSELAKVANDLSSPENARASMTVRSCHDALLRMWAET